MTTFGSYVHAIMDRGRDEARDDGSSAVEAQHLLLAIAAGPDAASRQALASAGLDHEAIRAALDREFEHSLATVGVSAAAFDLPRPSPRQARPSRLGASARLAVDRGFSGVGKKALRPAHLLFGILLAEAGTVPRALDRAGVERAGLAERVRQAAAPSGG